MQEALDALSRTGDGPDIPLQQLAFLYGQAVRKAKDKPGALTQFWSQLADIGFQLAASVLPLLSTEPIMLKDAKRISSQHDLFLFNLRRSAAQGERWDLLHSVCVNVITGKWQPADPKWFLLSFLEASCHLPSDIPTPDGLQVLVDQWRHRRSCRRS